MRLPQPAAQGLATDAWRLIPPPPGVDLLYKRDGPALTGRGPAIYLVSTRDLPGMDPYPPSASRSQRFAHVACLSVLLAMF